MYVRRYMYLLEDLERCDVTYMSVQHEVVGVVREREVHVPLLHGAQSGR